MMSSAELRSLAREIRTNTRVVDAELVDRISADVQEYRRILADHATQLPAPVLVDRLPLMGWLIYEASLRPLWLIPAGFLEGGDSDESIALVHRLIDLTRALPWPEFAPRALGSLRVGALIESKRDTEAGYDAAWLLHEDARQRYELYRASHPAGSPPEQFTCGLDEVLLQLALAEIGTACRASERVIGLWADGVEEGTWTEGASTHWTERMFRELTQGAAVGEYALRTAEHIERTYGFVAFVDEHRMALSTCYRNPAIMTCRALLLLYSMCPEMHRAGRQPEKGTWAGYQKELTARFFAAFGLLRRPVFDDNRDPVPLNEDHLRAMVQLCLHLALLTPGQSLAEDLVVDQHLTIRRLDDAAVEAMSSWLASPTAKGGIRGDANTIGSASKPSFIASVEACRRDTGRAADYVAWRRSWPELDRYRHRPGRAERLRRIFETAPGG